MLVKAGRNAQFRNFLSPHLLQRSLDEGFGAGDIIKTVHEFANAIGDEASEVTLYSEQSLIKFTIFIKKLSNRLGRVPRQDHPHSRGAFRCGKPHLPGDGSVSRLLRLPTGVGLPPREFRTESAARYVRRRRVCSRIRSIGNSSSVMHLLPALNELHELFAVNFFKTFYRPVSLGVFDSWRQTPREQLAEKWF